MSNRLCPVVSARDGFDTVQANLDDAYERERFNPCLKDMSAASNQRGSQARFEGDGAISDGCP